MESGENTSTLTENTEMLLRNLIPRMPLNDLIFKIRFRSREFCVVNRYQAVGARSARFRIIYR